MADYKAFVKYCISEICKYKGVTLTKIPKITLTNDKNKTQTLAHFDPNDYSIVCYKKDRLPADIMRSLAHELVHAVQMQAGEINEQSGITGSPQENEANSLAGIIMRGWGKQDKGIYSANVKESTTSNLNKPVAYDFGCLMLMLKFDKWTELLQKIPEREVYIEKDNPDKYGYETEPHITVLYGLEDHILPILELDKYLKRTFNKPISVEITGISFFDNKQFDVLKFDIHSPVLEKLHLYLKEKYPNNLEFDKYVPHITIAYLKKGYGKKYVKEFKTPKKVESSEFIYSRPSGVKEKIVIDEKESVAYETIKSFLGSVSIPKPNKQNR